MTPTLSMTSPTQTPATVVVGDALHQPRGIERTVIGQATQDGAGVKLTRVLTQPLQQRLDPFLMLDAFRSDDPNDWIGGFPDHPHRGFETVTYMLAGKMRHRDSAGHEGLLEGGGVQWMVAGSGVIHSELPEQTDGLMEGFQLWLNLPAADKMTQPWYRDIPSAQIPQVQLLPGLAAQPVGEAADPAAVLVRVIAGHAHGVDGAITRAHTEPLLLDLHLPAGSCLNQAIPVGHRGFIYVYRGEVTIDGAASSTVAAGRMGILADPQGGDGIVVRAQQPARLLLIAGRPLHEPIVQYGPFVMNSPAQIHQAIDDFRAGRFA